MYSSHFEMVYNQITEGVEIKVSRRDENLLMSEIVFKRGACFPEHIHLSDHSGYLLQGKICITKDGVSREMKQGDSWCIGKKILHYTEAIEDSVVIEVYSEDDSIYENQLVKCESDLE
jgi:quercetin dioxygenase-like cupin family protein